MSGGGRRSGSADLDELRGWLEAQEGEQLEFKEAKSRYPFETLAQYCCAFANEGGGRIILGATDRRPRMIVGTSAFPQLERTRRGLMDKVPLNIRVREIYHPDGRVLAFEVPSRPIGVPVKVDGVYWSRKADSLVPLSEDRLREIFAESARDFSAEICSGARLEDLDSEAIEDFRRRWAEKSGNNLLRTVPIDQILRDAELLADDGLTNAALVLFGSRPALGRLLSQAEIVFEYRSSESAGPAQQREEYRRGFFSFYEELWRTINLRNDAQHYQDGLFVYDVRTFAERSVREALLNAVSHRDYQLAGSIFVRQYPRRMVVQSPGGFPLGITEENILDRQSPRNRRIAEVFAKCGLVERSGQGMNLMFEESIRQGKDRPDFTGTDPYTVVLSLHGQVSDPQFVGFLENVGRETLLSFSTQDFLLLDLVHHERPIPPEFAERTHRLTELGVLEKIGRGRGTRHLLSRRFYAMTGAKGAYTRRRGLDDETNKELLLRHLREQPTGSPLAELEQVVPQLGRAKVQRLLGELREEGKVILHGSRRWAKWRISKATSPEKSV